MFHDNRELFEQAVLQTAEFFGIEAGIVEKDYFVTLTLKEIVRKLPRYHFQRRNVFIEVPQNYKTLFGRY